LCLWVVLLRFFFFFFFFLGLRATQIQHKSIEHLGPWANNPSPSNASSTSRETRVGGRHVVLSSSPQKPPRTDHENKLHHLEASYPYTAKLTRSSPNFSIQQMKKKLPHAMQTDPQIRSSVSPDCFFTPRSCHPILWGKFGSLPGPAVIDISSTCMIDVPMG